MKYLIYTLATILIASPFIIWATIKLKTEEDIIVHDSYIGIGSLVSSPKTWACISIAIGFILLAANFHKEYKIKDQETIKIEET